MKKTIKKLTAVGLTLTSVMGLVACGSSNDSNAAGGSSSSKEVTKPDKFTIMCDSTVVTETNGAAAFYEQLKTATGLDFQWTRPDHSGYYDAVANAFNSDETMPDVVLLSSDYYALYASNGFLWNIRLRAPHPCRRHPPARVHGLFPPWHSTCRARRQGRRGGHLWG